MSMRFIHRWDHHIITEIKELWSGYTAFVGIIPSKRKKPYKRLSLNGLTYKVKKDEVRY